MEKEEIIDVFSGFLTEFYYTSLLKASNEGTKSIEVDFRLLERFDVELADQFLDSPEQTMVLFREALSNIDIPDTKMKLRFFNLPESRDIRIRNIRSEHLGKLIVVDGMVKRASEIRPEISEAIFECADCGSRISVTQTERAVNYPAECENPSCGSRRRFKLVDQKLFDARWIFIEEPFEITSGERPSDIMVYLKEDLTSPKMQNKTDPGNRIKVTGVLKELPKRVKGTRSRQMDIYLDANHVQNVEVEWDELDINPEDEKAILELARDPNIYNKLVASIAPTIYGLDEVKQAIIMQLFGGVQHIQKDKSRVRGDLHVLLVGDPSCLVGDERIVLGNGAIIKIESVGTNHLENINLPVYLAEGYKRGLATVFHKFEFQPVVEVVTESGKSIKGTHNHPLLTKDGWKRLDQLHPGDEVRTVNWIPCSIHKYLDTGWSLNRKFHKQSKKITIPKVVDERLASILGYMLADGYVQEYRAGCVFNYGETDLIEKLRSMFKEVFGLEPMFGHHDEKGGVDIDMVYNSGILANLLRFLKVKRVPDIIMRSKNSVVASFLSWLYDGDGSVVAKGRGKNGILYKAKDIELLRDIQVLLLRFGVHSRIYGNNLMIRQSESILKFVKSVGFNSKKKQAKLSLLEENISRINRRWHKKMWERIVKIAYHPPETVYDIEVPHHHKFVANGVVSHNTAKSALMKVVSGLIPRGRYVSGKGVTGAGLTATVVKDEEFLGGWVLEAGAIVMANRSLVAIDEFEKIEKTDQVALHEAMEQQSISIAKASIVATLPAATSILAGGNPKYGRFDPYIPVKEQVDIPETIMSRFDLKFALRDIPNVEKDTKMAEHILQSRHYGEIEIKPEIDTSLLRRFVAYARKNCKPKLTRVAGEEIKKFYLELRVMSKDGPISITTRQYEALIRLAEASAKVQLRDEVNREDALRAINLVKFSLRQLGMEPGSDTIDIDRAEGQVMTAAQRNKTRIMLEILEELAKLFGREIPEAEIIKSAEKKGMSEWEVKDMIDKMKKETQLYSPRHGIVSKV